MSGRRGQPTLPLFSVLIGRVSTEDEGRVLETLEALHTQQTPPPLEVVIADRRQDAVVDLIRIRYPKVRLIACPRETSIPDLRTIALEHAKGDVIVVIEDHCVPGPTWLAGMARAFREAPASAAAVGGCVENGVVDRALDWATFLCEYSAFTAPVADGPVDNLPGMNVAYRRSALAKQPRAALTSGFWETTVHPQLRAAGATFYSSNAIKLFHAKRFSFGLFVRQRFIYSRYYAGRRFPPAQRLRRLLACCLTPALPPILLLRMARSAFAKPQLRRPLLHSLPTLAVFTVVWAAGEMVGYLAGPGDALARIE